MAKRKYIMKTDKPAMMDLASLDQFKNISIAPYMQLATALIGKRRKYGGNMFRHQIDTLGILIDYGYIDPILLKASLVHDTIEDIPGFDQNSMINADSDGPEVHSLVLEVSKREGEKKPDFLKRIIDTGSQRAKILKCADRISNMISLGYIAEREFISRYCDETEFYILPIAIEVDFNMYQELIELIISRRKIVEESEGLN